jgi:histidinol dehydrogenase
LRVERLEIGGHPAGAAARARALAPTPESVAEPVRQIIDAVRAGGDRALREFVARFDTGGADPPPLRVGADALAAATLDPAVRAGLDVATTNVALVADAGVGDDKRVVLPQGHHVVVREVPVRRAAVYAPAGRAPYPSTVVMGVITARVAGVEEVCVVSPPPVHPTILGTCAHLGVGEVYAMGGAHAVAALAHGTDSVPRVDVIVGPGNLWVQEAKRAVSGSVGIDGFYGPSDLVVLCTTGADPELVALDLLGQAEHGPETVVAAVSDDAALLGAVGDLAERRDGADPAALVLAAAGTPAEALAFAEAFAPEHLELVGAAAERLAPRVRSAGCVLVGADGGTAFSDYVAGSNHCLPTGGAARFASGLGARHFRRRVSEVHIDGAATALAAAGAAVARAEGFVLHAESMEARVRDEEPAP